MKARSPTKEALSAIRTDLKNKLIASRQSNSKSITETEFNTKQEEAKKLGLNIARPPDSAFEKSFPTELNDEDATQVLFRMASQRRESIEDFKKADREDLVEKEILELRVIQSFLPQQLTEEQLVQIIKQTIVAIDAGGPEDMGRLMKALMPKVKGQADGKLIQAKVRELLV